MEVTLLFNRFFSRLSIHALVAKIGYSPRKLCNGAQMANFWRSFATCISASRVQYLSDLHSKFALKPQHAWKPPKLYSGAVCGGDTVGTVIWKGYVSAGKAYRECY